MGPYQRTPKEVARAIRFSGLGVRSVGPVGDFLENRDSQKESGLPTMKFLRGELLNFRGVTLGKFDAFFPILP